MLLWSDDGNDATACNKNHVEYVLVDLVSIRNQIESKVAYLYLRRRNERFPRALPDAGLNSKTVQRRHGHGKVELEPRQYGSEKSFSSCEKIN